MLHWTCYTKVWLYKIWALGSQSKTKLHRSWHPICLGGRWKWVIVVLDVQSACSYHHAHRNTSYVPGEKKKKNSNKKTNKKLWFFSCLSGTNPTSENTNVLAHRHARKKKEKNCFTFIVSTHGTHAGNIKYSASANAKTVEGSVCILWTKRKSHNKGDYE